LLTFLLLQFDFVGCGVSGAIHLSYHVQNSSHKGFYDAHACVKKLVMWLRREEDGGWRIEDVLQCMIKNQFQLK